MHIAEIWRYPVKSMAGERLSETELGRDGIDGDRRLHVDDGRGRVVTARTHPRLLGHRARPATTARSPSTDVPGTTPRSPPPWPRSPAPASQLVPTPEGVFDILPLLVATDGAIEAFGHDRRRLRPNLVIGGVPGLDERGWEGRGLRVGDALIALADLRGRCVMTTYDPDTLVQDPGVLKSIVRRFGGSLALNATAVAGGRLREGDRVELVTADQMRELAPLGV